MKTFIISIVLLALSSTAIAQVSINTDNSMPDSSAILDIKSIEKGVLVPRMNSTQRNDISNPANGLLVFDSTTESFWFQSSGQWIELVDRENAKWQKNGSNIYFNSGKVGIGTTSPARQLHTYFNNGNLNTSSFLIDQAGTGDAFFNIGLAGSHHYNIGVDRSDGGKFKISYDATKPWGIAVNNRLAIESSGQIGIGTSSPSDRLQIDGVVGESPLRVRIGGVTKLRVRDNGGVTIGQNVSAPADGLRVKGMLQPDGNIITPANLLVESNGASTFLQLKKGLTSCLLDDAGLFGFANDVLIMETNISGNKVEMNPLGTTVSSTTTLKLQTGIENNNIQLNNDGIATTSNDNIIIETLGNNRSVTIKAGNTNIVVSEAGGITIESNGSDLNINSQGGGLLLNSGNGDISFDAGNGNISFNADDIDINAGGFLDATSAQAMTLESTGSSVGLTAGGTISAMSGTTCNIDAGTTLNMDAGSLMTLDAPLMKLNNGALGAARKTDGTVGGPAAQTIVTGSGSVLIGN